MQSEQVYLFRVEDYSSTSDLGYRDFELDLQDCSLTELEESVSEEQEIPELVPVCSSCESTRPGEQNDSLTELEESVSESNSVNTYRARGKARGEHYYFRYSYRDGTKIRHRHIKGGNTSNPIAIARAEIVRAACREGRSCQQILELIESFET